MSGISDQFAPLIQSIFNCLLNRSVSESVSHLDFNSREGPEVDLSRVGGVLLTLTLPHIICFPLAIHQQTFSKGDGGQRFKCEINTAAALNVQFH